MLDRKIKRFPTRFLVGAYKGVETVERIREEFRETGYAEESGGLSVLNMVVFKKDLVGITSIHQLGTPEAMIAACKKAIRDGMIKDITDAENDDEVEKVREHYMLRISEDRIKSIGEILPNKSSAIICVFEEVLVYDDTFQTEMKDHQKELTERVKAEIGKQLAVKANKAVAVHVALHEDPEKVILFESAVGSDALENVRGFIASAGDNPDPDPVDPGDKTDRGPIADPHEENPTDPDPDPEATPGPIADSNDSHEENPTDPDPEDNPAANGKDAEKEHVDCATESDDSVDADKVDRPSGPDAEKFDRPSGPDPKRSHYIYLCVFVVVALVVGLAVSIL